MNELTEQKEQEASTKMNEFLFGKLGPIWSKPVLRNIRIWWLTKKKLKPGASYNAGMDSLQILRKECTYVAEPITPMLDIWWNVNSEGELEVVGFRIYGIRYFFNKFCPTDEPYLWVANLLVTMTEYEEDIRNDDKKRFGEDRYGCSLWGKYDRDGECEDYSSELIALASDFWVRTS